MKKNIIFRFPIFIALGSTLLFGSAVCQNYFKNKWTQEISMLDRVQTLLSIEEGHAIQWRHVLEKEQRRTPRNEELLSEAAFQYSVHSINSIDFAMYRARGARADKGILRKNKLLSIINVINARNNKDVEKALEYVANLDVYMVINRPKLGLEASARYEVVANNESNWNIWFLYLYFLGSVLLGVGAIRGWYASNKKFNDIKEFLILYITLHDKQTIKDGSHQEALNSMKNMHESIYCLSKDLKGESEELDELLYKFNGLSYQVQEK